MGKYKGKVESANARLLNGSVDIDEGVKKKYPDANRWDYVLSYNSEVYFIEVHSAHTKDVSLVLKKHQWLKDWLLENAPELNKLKPKAKPAFYWIQSKNFQIQQRSSQYLRAINAGLKPIAKLILN